MSNLQQQQATYAHLLIKIGVNLQPGQSLRLSGELEHRDFVRAVVAEAYKAGARYVQVEWHDTPTGKARLIHSQPDHLDYVPDYLVARHQQMVDECWARLSLVGPEFPDLLEDVDPTLMRRAGMAQAQKLKFYSQAVMNNELQWCVAGVPTVAWAQKIFPTLSAPDAVDRLWQVILQTCRIDQDDPIAAWQQHDQNLKQVVDFMAKRQVRTVRYLDPTPGPDGKPATDLTVGLTDHPAWVGAAAYRPDGIQFLPNMPTEEVFTTPHSARTEGWVRTSKPGFPFDRKVENAYFRFEAGEVVEFHATTGQDALEQFFTVPGAKRLGEMSLVDARSPINQSGLIFYETLFDENAVSHIAFGKAYPDGVVGGAQMSEDELTALGVNQSDTHVDFMVGTDTMRVLGLCADGQEVIIMADGQFTRDVLGDAA